MDPMLIALITPTWDWLTRNQNATALGIALAGLANITVLVMIARVVFFYPADFVDWEGGDQSGKVVNPLLVPMGLARGRSALLQMRWMETPQTQRDRSLSGHGHSGVRVIS